MPKLEDLGWGPREAQAFAPHAAQGWEPARVAAEHQHVFTLLTAEAELLARVTGQPAPHGRGSCRLHGRGRLGGGEAPAGRGTLLLMAATPDMTTDRLVFSALSLVYLVIGIWLEERSLGVEFGSAYDEYQKVVRWRLVPWIY